MKKIIVTTIIPSILVYFILLLLYLFDRIDALFFLGVLLLSILMLGILFIVFYKKSRVKKPLGISMIILSVLFAFEFSLLFYLSVPAYLVRNYIPPEEIVESSGIYTIGVGELKLDTEESEESFFKSLTNQGIDVLSIDKIDNQMIYGVKNRQLLSWLHLSKEHTPKEMVETVQSYFGKEEEWMSQWFTSSAKGDSAGLSLVLSELYKRGDLENQLPIAITGGINKHGTVTEVGAIKEKLQTIEKAGIPFAILPSKNKTEALKFHSELKSSVKLFFVSDVKEAQQKITELNMKRKGK